MNLQKENHDVVIVGTGTAGLSAALAAYEKNSEAKLLLIEKAPRESRGGNGRFTGGDLRYCHKGIDEIRGYLPNVSEELLDAVDIPEYTADDFYTDIMRVTRGCADREFWELVIRESNPAIKWLTRLGVVWDIRTERTVKVDGRFVFRHGEGGIGTKNAGEGLIEGMFEIAERQGIEVRYDTKAVKLLTDNKGAVNGVKILGKDGLKDICCRSVILATGGFSANVEMRTKYLGPKWDLVKVRGSRYNTGEGLKMAMELGAAPIGQWSGSHNTILDADAPDFGAGMGAARYTFQHSIMVNENGQRFVDEGSDFQIYTYAKMGSIVLEQPRGIAFQIFDNKVIHLLRGHGALGGKFADAGFKGIDVVKRVGAFDDCQIRVFGANGADKFFQERADLNQAGGQMQGFDAVLLEGFHFLPDSLGSHRRRASAAADDADQFGWVFFGIAFKHPLPAPHIAKAADHHTVHVLGRRLTT